MQSRLYATVMAPGLSVPAVQTQLPLPQVSHLPRHRHRNPPKKRPERPFCSPNQCSVSGQPKRLFSGPPACFYVMALRIM